MADRIQNRRDTKARWEQYNPVLLEGEMGIVTDDPNLYKVGDGVTAWNSLPYRGFNGTITSEVTNDENSVPSNKAVFEKVDFFSKNLRFPQQFLVFIYHQDNLFLKATTKTPGYIDINGGTQVLSNFYYTDFIDISTLFNGLRNRKLVFNELISNAGAFYDESKNFIEGIGTKHPALDLQIYNFYNFTVDVPENAKYIRLNNTWNNLITVVPYVEGEVNQQPTCYYNTVQEVKALDDVFATLYSGTFNGKQNLLKDVLLIKGCYLGKDGSEVLNDNWGYTSDYIPIENMTILLMYNVPNIAGVFYDSNKQFLSIITRGDTNLSYRPWFTEGAFVNAKVRIPKGAAYARFNVNLISYHKGEAFVYDYSVVNPLNRISLPLNIEVDLPLIPISKQLGYLQSDGTINTSILSGGTLYKFELPEDKSIVKIIIWSVINCSRDWDICWFLDIEGNILKQVHMLEFHNFTSTLVNRTFIEASFRKPEGATHLLISAGYCADKLVIPIVSVNSSSLNYAFTYLCEDLLNRNLVENKTEGVKSHWDSKVWYAYGTSLTSPQQGKYAPYLAQLSGLKLTNKGIPGGGIVSNRNIYNAVMDESDGKTNADLITLEVLANDGAAPFGEVTDSTNETFLGALGLCLKFLSENTHAQIVLMPSPKSRTPLGNTSEVFTPQSQYTSEYVVMINKMRLLAQYYDVYFIDPNTAINIYRRTTKTFKDNIHHTDLGGYNYAQFIWSRLKDIPLWYESIPS